MTQTIFYIIIFLLVFEFVLTKVLGYLNTLNWSSEIPKELKDIYDEKKYKKSQQYEKEKYKFSTITWSISFLLMFFVFIFWGFGWLDSFVREFTQNQILLALYFFGIITLVQTLVSLPLSYYSTFVIEEKYGFNKSTKKIFFLDTLKTLLLTAIIGWGLLSLIVLIYSLLGSNFWIYAWGIITAFSVFFMMFYSSLIVPLFNKQIPLEDGKLKTAINNFAEKVGFKLDNIYVIDGSKRSSKANAYFSGFWPKKRIVLFDTLINDMTTEEIVGVLAHEIGHYKRKHTLQMLAFSIVQTGFMLYIFSLTLGIKEVSFALWGTIPSFHLGMIAFGILFTPISMILGILGNMLSRRNEYQADEFAGKNYNPKKLQSALKKLSINNLSNLRPHPAYEFFYYSHPTVLKRLEALEKMKKKDNIMSKFFSVFKFKK